MFKFDNMKIIMEVILGIILGIFMGIFYSLYLVLYLITLPILFILPAKYSKSLSLLHKKWRASRPSISQKISV